MDFHTSPHIGGVGAEFNEEEFAAVLQDAHVNSINLFAKCRCISLLMDRQLIRADLPTTAEVSLRKRGDGFVLHILNYLIQRKCRNIDIIEDKLPLYHRAVAIRLDRKPSAIRLVPEGRQIGFDWAGGYARFTVPEVDGHRMISIE